MGRGKKELNGRRAKPRAVAYNAALEPAVATRAESELTKAKNPVQRAAAERVLAEGDTGFSIKKGTGKSLVWQFRHYLESGDERMISPALRECLANELNAAVSERRQVDRFGTGNEAAGTSEPACFLGNFYYWNDRTRVPSSKTNQYVYADGMTSDAAVEAMLAVADEHKHRILNERIARNVSGLLWSHNDAFALAALATVCDERIIFGYCVPDSHRGQDDFDGLMVANPDVTEQPGDLSPGFGAGGDEQLISGAYRISPARALEIAAAADSRLL